MHDLNLHVNRTVANVMYDESVPPKQQRSEFVKQLHTDATFKSTLDVAIQEARGMAAPHVGDTDVVLAACYSVNLIPNVLTEGYLRRHQPATSDHVLEVMGRHAQNIYSKSKQTITNHARQRQQENDPWMQ
jgi:cell division septum initiation protein DivIVA